MFQYPRWDLHDVCSGFIITNAASLNRRLSKSKNKQSINFLEGYKMLHFTYKNHDTEISKKGSYHPYPKLYTQLYIVWLYEISMIMGVLNGQALHIFLYQQYSL